MEEPVRTTSFWIAVAFAVVMFLIGIWDSYFIGKGQYQATVSAVLRSWSYQSTIFPIIVGMIIGHVFLCGSITVHENKERGPMKQEQLPLSPAPTEVREPNADDQHKVGGTTQPSAPVIPSG